MPAISCILLGYLIGCINPAYIVGKRKGFDIRKRGSGNAGASNAVIVMGKKAGVLSALFDIFKAVLVVSLATKLFADLVYAKILAGVSCIVGHIFPASMGFRGGKGLACLGGLILAYDWKIFLIRLLAELLIAFAVDYICVVPITASLAFPVIYAVQSKEPIGTFILLGCAVVILFKHMENLQRIRNGSEAHFSFLWKRDEEIARLTENSEKNEQTDSE
jgi:glycerol-3-phosphate acyltransferase PlsY